MAIMTHAAAADFKMLDQLESGSTTAGKAPISPQDFALSVAQSLSAKQKLWGNLQQFKNNEDQVLSTWFAFRLAATTVWSRGHLWMVAARLVMVYVCIAVASLMFFAQSTAQSVDRVAKMSLVIRIVVGLLIGFLFTSSLSRWHKCSSGFLVLFDAIQHLQMQFIALGCADEENAMRAVRYGLLSAHLLNMKLHCEAQQGAAQKQAFAEMWAKLSVATTTTKGHDEDENMGMTKMKCAEDNLVAEIGGLLHDEELEILQRVDDASGMIWVWVASLLGRMAQDGSISAMDSSTFGQIVDLANVARDGIRQVLSCASIQTPHVCVRVLAVAVQINNLMSAVSFGMILGTSGEALLAGKVVSVGGDAAERDLQTFFVAFFFCVCGPLLYQAFLEVAVLVALPYSSTYEETPAREMISRLETNLHEASVVSRQWQQPSFKVPSVP